MSFEGSSLLSLAVNWNASTGFFEFATQVGAATVVSTCHSSDRHLIGIYQGVKATKMCGMP